ncbi:relaxase MobL [Listeria aquatica]|uniref:relaxase MobL n=1 Tax=Listeria aquatica TaxID=1494960 RepID=UPI0004AFDE2B|nr:relaxase MobL [Listeria aquatica]
MGRPGIVLASSFVSSTDEKFQKYVEYMNREEAIRNEAFEKYNIIAYEQFNDYMENPAKSSGLFSATEDYLDEKKSEPNEKMVC